MSITFHKHDGITEVGNNPPPLNVLSSDFDFFRPASNPNKGGGVIPAPSGSLRRASRRSHSGFWASQKSPFSTGFIRFFDMAESHSVYTEKPNAFLILFGAKT